MAIQQTLIDCFNGMQGKKKESLKNLVRKKTNERERW